MGKKNFEGSWLILILLIILCWPAAIVYFLLKYQEDETEMRTCMGCGAKINLYYTTCPYCGRATTPAYAAQQYPAPQPVVDRSSTAPISYCKNCGAGLSADQDFCISCGTKLK